VRDENQFRTSPIIGRDEKERMMMDAWMIADLAHLPSRAQIFDDPVARFIPVTLHV
jgi:hypothetical protein